MRNSRHRRNVQEIRVDSRDIKGKTPRTTTNFVDSSSLDFNQKDRVINHLKNIINRLKEDLNNTNNTLDYYYENYKLVSEEIKTLQNQLQQYEQYTQDIKKENNDLENKIQELENLNISKNQDIEEYKSIIQRIKADFENAEKRHQQNQEETNLQVKGKVILNFLDVFEDLERFTIHSINPEVKEKLDELKTTISEDEEKEYTVEELLEKLKDVFDDLKYLINALDNALKVNDNVITIKNKFEQILQQEGLEEIPAKGEKYNPQLHDAVMVNSSEDVENNYIIEEFSKGYMINGRILKTSKVNVCKK